MAGNGSRTSAERRAPSPRLSAVIGLHAAAALLMLAVAGALPLSSGARIAAATPEDVGAIGSMRVLPVRGGISMVIGPAGNTTVQTGPQGLLVVDTQSASAATALVDALRALSPSPVRFIVNTAADSEHAGGNAAIAKAGQSNFAGRRPEIVPSSGGAPIYAHEKVLNRLIAANVAEATWPTFTYFGRQRDLFVNDEAVQLFHVEAAHTDGDSIVMFRRTDVISTGDVFTPDRYPMIDLAAGGGIDGLLDGINRILELAVSGPSQEGGTLIVPGHGRLCDESDVSDYRDMVTIIRDRVRDLRAKGRTLEQVKADG